MSKRKVLTAPVAYRNYKLLINKKLPDGDLGLTNYSDKTIAVSKLLTDYGNWSQTFWHEWMHAVTHELGYEQISDNEAFVEAMAGAIMTFLTDPNGRAILQNMMDKIPTRK